MEVGGFLMPHQIYHERRPASPAPAAAGGPPRRMRTAPHEFYDGTMVGFGGVPAAASAVAGLAETTMVAAGGGSGEEETCCAVCLEGYAAGDALTTMPCAHAFHEGCIVEWLSVSRFCTLCRFGLPSQEEEDAAAAQHY